MSEYAVIDDWSVEGRRALVDRAGDAIRAMLEEAFFRFSDHHELAPFGFRGDDPVGDAVEWALDQFRRPEFDGNRLYSQDRSMRIFTRAEYWLAFKVGRAHLDRVRWRRYWPDGDKSASFESRPGPLRADAGVEVHELIRRLAEALRELARRTCADLVGYWLEHTASLRARLAWDPKGEPVASPPHSPKIDSQYGHDALFRYQCLFEGLVPSSSADLVARAAEHALFEPCSNRPPYRRPPEVVRVALAAPASRDARVEALVRDGAERLVKALVDGITAAWPAVSTERDGVDAARFLLLRGAVAPTTLDALGIGKREELRSQVRDLPRLEIAEDSR